MDDGASVGFLAPLHSVQAGRYWQQVLAGLGPYRHMWIAHDSGQLLGTVQRALCAKAIDRHRGEIQKLMVAPACRGRGVARQRMAEDEATAQAAGCTLLMLDTEAGSAAPALYHLLGWQVADSIPDVASRPHGSLAATVLHYKLLAPASAATC